MGFTPTDLTSRTRPTIYAPWPPSVGPLLSLGMLTAAARTHLARRGDDRWDVRRPEPIERALSHLATHDGPALWLCSDYVFTQDENLEAAHRARAMRPDLVILRGGPSVPKYDDDLRAFHDRHGAVCDLAVHGEGEATICELLDALEVVDGELVRDPDRLAQVAGTSFRHPATGEIVRTPARERIASLRAIPSPYLTGEFDDIPADEWVQPPYFETNRGCPYGCSFCDWGSATQSRIRAFPLERVLGEFAWAAERGHRGLHLCDANFGILPRDVEIAERIAEMRRATGYPAFAMFTPAKNTTRRLAPILDALTGAGVSVAAAISLQTTDEATLTAVARENITTAGYLALAADLRLRGHALQGDLILGLPGQTYTSYRADLQFMLDHEIMPRTFPLRVLPNAPLNDPAYRARHGIDVSPTRLVRSTATLGEAARRRALLLRRVEAITERYGLLRHVYRYLQWDHGLPATHLMEHLVEALTSGHGRAPVLSATLSTFDTAGFPAAGWPALYDEVHRMVVEVTGVDDAGLATVLLVQERLMPARGRAFPEVVALPHDYVAWYAEATAELFRSGRAGTPHRRLEDHGPGELEILGDPLGLCEHGISFAGDSDDEDFEGDFHIGALAANELHSPLARLVPALASHPEVVRTRLSIAPEPEAGSPEAGSPEAGSPEAEGAAADGAEAPVTLRPPKATPRHDEPRR
jgi:hypothetical protein